MTLSESLAGLPAFLTYFGLSLALLAVFLAVYLAVTPYSELPVFTGPVMPVAPSPQVTAPTM